MEIDIDIKDMDGTVIARCANGHLLGDIKAFSSALHQLATAIARAKIKPLDCQGVPSDGKGKIDIK